MPVSFAPCFWPFLAAFIALFVYLVAKSESVPARLRARAAWVAVAAFGLLMLGWPSLVYGRGLGLRIAASTGSPDAQFAYARWVENHCETINALVLWPCRPNVERGYAWLERAARNGHVQAMYVVGVREKHDLFADQRWRLPMPAAALVQGPMHGQDWIDAALARGFQPPTASEESYYWQVYRR